MHSLEHGYGYGAFCKQNSALTGTAKD